MHSIGETLVLIFILGGTSLIFAMVPILVIALPLGYYRFVLVPLAAKKWTFSQEEKAFQVSAAGRQAPVLLIDEQEIVLSAPQALPSTGRLWRTSSFSFSDNGQDGAVILTWESWRPRHCEVKICGETVFTGF